MQSLADIRQFRRPSTSVSRRKLPLPLADGLRIAQVSPRGLLFTETHYISLDHLSTLSDFQPQVLVGSSAELEVLARYHHDGGLTLASLDRALFVITDCRDVPLRDSTRLVLWRAFGVPLYELLLSSDGSPIAAECDAHDGWHIQPGVSFSLVHDELWFQPKRAVAQGTGLTGEIHDAPCPCGQPGKRILNAAMDFRDPVRQQLAQTA